MADCTGRCQDCSRYSREDKLCRVTGKFTRRKHTCEHFKSRKPGKVIGVVIGVSVGGVNEHYEMSALR